MYWNKDVLVLGCGNILFGDDGFGPGVAEYMNAHMDIPAGTAVIDAGLSVREILFNIALSEKRPRKIFIVDAIDDINVKRVPGEVFQLDIDGIPAKKVDDFSMHQVPTSNLLKELKEICGVDVTIICTQVEYIPPEVRPGLSEAVQAAIPIACEKIIRSF